MNGKILISIPYHPVNFNRVSVKQSKAKRRARKNAARFTELENEHKAAIAQREGKDHASQEPHTQKLEHGLGDWQDDKALRRIMSRESLDRAKRASEEERRPSRRDLLDLDAEGR